MFNLPDLTKVHCTNANPRRELHGSESVRAIDLTFEWTTTNDFLDTLEAGLRAHHYFNEAATNAGQEQLLPDELIPLPDLRFVKLSRHFKYGADGEKARGYKFVLDYGLGDDKSNITLEDCVLMPIHYTVNPDGVVNLKATVQYNGGALDDDARFGRLSGLASAGELNVQIVAPDEPKMVKGKGWRSGRAEAVATDNGAPLFEDGDAEDGDAEDDLGDEPLGDSSSFEGDADDEPVHEEGSAEAAFIATAADEVVADRPKSRRGLKAREMADA